MTNKETLLEAFRLIYSYREDYLEECLYIISCQPYFREGNYDLIHEEINKSKNTINEQRILTAYQQLSFCEDAEVHKARDMLEHILQSRGLLDHDNFKFITTNKGSE